MLRTYLLNAANGIKRVHWYAWDKPSLGNTKMSFASTGGPTLAGKAFDLAQAWLSGGKLVGASSVGQAVRQGPGRHLHLRHQVRRGRPPRVLEPDKKVKVTTVKCATYKMGVYAKKATIKGGSRSDGRPPAADGAVEVLTDPVEIGWNPAPPSNVLVRD